MGPRATEPQHPLPGVPPPSPKHPEGPRHRPAVSMSSVHMQSRQRGPAGTPALLSLGALSSFSLVLGACGQGTEALLVGRDMCPGVVSFTPTLPLPFRAHTPVHGADRGGELGLQPEHEGFHQPVDAGLFGGLGTIRWEGGLQEWPWSEASGVGAMGFSTPSAPESAWSWSEPGHTLIKCPYC